MSDVFANLYTLQPLSIYAVFMSVTAVMAGLGCLALAPIAKPPATKEHLDVAMRTTGAVMAALTLILAFCAVQARTQSADAQTLVNREIAAISSLGRTADRIGAAALEVKRHLIAYTRSIAEAEFEGMVLSGPHAETQRLVESIEQAVYMTAGTVSDSVANDLISEFEDVESARERRLHSARLGLPREFWMLIGLLFTLLALTGALYPAKKHTVAMLAVQAAGCGALIAFVFIVDQPFRGTVRLTSEPYSTVIRTMEHHATIIRQGPRFAAP
jgi:hypothetical protein